MSGPSDEDAPSLAQLAAEPWSVAELAVPTTVSASPEHDRGAPDDPSSGAPVLLVGCSFDVHLDLIARELAKRRIETVRVDIDAAAGPGRWAAIQRLAGRGPFAAGVCRSIDLVHPLAVHGRRTALRAEPWAAVDPFVRSFAGEQLQQALLGWLDECEVGTWINDPWTIPRAEIKARQLRLAASSGLAVPRTLITDDAAAVRELATSCEGGIVYKGLADPFVWRDGDDAGFLYTTPMTASLLDGLDTTLVHPGIFQERLHPIAELRATVVGDDVFVARVAHGPRPELDWRRDMPGGSATRRAALPPETIDGVVETVRRLGLRYGAVDLVDTSDGIVFLEVNPSGAYSWLEAALALPITATICDHLVPPAEI